VLGGHIHLPYVLDLAARETPTPRPMWCVQAGTARVVAGAARHLQLGELHRMAPAPRQRMPRHCLLERWDYDGDAGASSAPRPGRWDWPE
jgi:hypothetical protein